VGAEHESSRKAASRGPEAAKPSDLPVNRAPGRTRTYDRQIRRLLLYPLSYGGGSRPLGSPTRRASYRSRPAEPGVAGPMRDATG
jgi:hypothetical protein